MIDPRNRLTLFYKDGANAPVEFSRDVADYSRDEYTLTLKAGDLIYIGYEKPINAVYIEFSTASTIDGNITVQSNSVNDGIEDVELLDDDTRNFKRSGFIQWQRGRNENDHILETPEPGMPEGYYFRLSTDTDTEAVTIKGLNIVFSDDQDLERIVPCITDANFLQGQSSFILQHVSSRDEVVQRFRNRGVKKRRLEDANFQLLLPWDLLDVHEVRQGAAFLTLSKIFFNLSDEPDDVWNQKSLFYRSEYEKQIEIAQASFDLDDDGEIDQGEEQKAIKFQKMPR